MPNTLLSLLPPGSDLLEKMEGWMGRWILNHPSSFATPERNKLQDFKKKKIKSVNLSGIPLVLIKEAGNCGLTHH